MIIDFNLIFTTAPLKVLSSVVLGDYLKFDMIVWF